MKLHLAAAASALVLASAAAAQDATPQGQADPSAGPMNPPVAQQCLDDLQAFHERMEQEGFWVSGYRAGYGWSGIRPGVIEQGVPAVEPGMPAQQAPAAGAVPAAPPAAETAVPADPALGVEPGMATGPWGNARFAIAPGQEIAALENAAAILGHRGNQAACETILAELDDAYSDYVAMLREAGVEPGQMVSYRQEQLAAAVPVAQAQRAMRIDSITGTDLRNAQDERLGSVEDVVFNPDTGEVSHVIVARGGFLGIGREYVAVPWSMLRVTPNFDSFVLNVPRDVVEQAPRIDADAFASHDVYLERRAEIDGYWQQHAASEAG